MKLRFSDFFSGGGEVWKDHWNEMVNPLQPSVVYLYPLKTAENLKIF